jgi:hypothetical protein
LRASAAAWLALNEHAIRAGVVAVNAAAPKTNCLRIKTGCSDREEDSVDPTHDRLYSVHRLLGSERS